MGRIAQVVKNIISGISQQPPIMRHMEQLQEQINGFSTESRCWRCWPSVR